MKDRISLYPGRVKLTPVEGQENTYDLERADEPTEVGTALSTANLLPDYVAEALGLPAEENPTPAKAFKKIAEGIEPELSAIAVTEGESTAQLTLDYADASRRSIALSFDADSKLQEISVDGRAIPVSWLASAEEA